MGGLRRRHLTDCLRLTRAVVPLFLRRDVVLPWMLQCNLAQVMGSQFFRSTQSTLRSCSASADRLKMSSEVMRLCSTTTLKASGHTNPAFTAQRDLAQRPSSKSNVAYRATGILS